MTNRFSIFAMDRNTVRPCTKDFSVFKASSEMTNGRGAMVGLVSLLLAEKFTNGALFHF